MSRIAEARERLEQATGLAQVLDASWMAFDVMVAVCEHCQEGSHELFPAFAFAAAAAAEGRTLIAAAPSLPPGTVPAARGDDAQAGLDQAADALADLAQALHRRLSQACRPGGAGPDAVACAQAGFRAAHVHKLLAPEQ